MDTIKYSYVFILLVPLLFLRAYRSFFGLTVMFFLVLSLQSAALAGSWGSMPGWAIDAGDGWVIGHAQAGGGNQIFRWNGQGWDLMPGGAIQIGGTYATPWIVNSNKQIFHWNE